jgi:uracil-DNA glycosylase
VVILGQDPYHGAGQAHGLCFSVGPGVTIPPSLKNIFKELESDLGILPPAHGNLTHWADQGVLLLNAVLSVEQGKAASHRKRGWEFFTTRIIEILNQQDHPIVFLLWGSDAQKKGDLIDRNRHPVLMAPHPSPLSAHRGFLGCKHFSKTNTLLRSWGEPEIDWHIPPL